MNRRFLFLAGIAGALGVATGALGSHTLRDRLGPEGLATWETAVRYHLIHAVGLVFVALLLDRRPSRLVSAIGWLFLAGIVLFSGSLYVLALDGPGWVGPVTPVGGVCLIAGWVALAGAGLRGSRS